MNILIKNLDIITADSGNMLVKNGSIGIRNGFIEFVRGSGTDCSDFKADRVIEGKHRLAMPGLVNSHTHSAMTLLRNFADDLALEDWLFKKIFPAEDRITPEHIYWGALLGITEMIKSGTTTFADMYLHMDSVARAVCETGIWANLSISPQKFNLVSDKSEVVDETEKCQMYHKSWNNKGDGRIKVYIEVHSVYLFNEATLKSSAQLAKELDTGIQTHTLETVREREQSYEKYGMSSVEICEKCGIFDVPVISAHCVHLSDEDMEIIRKKEVNVSHNPTSNLKLGSGIARVPEMLGKGINVALGTDGTASNNNLNMFEEMHISAILHKGVHKDPTLVNARQAIEMATINGAKAAGFGKLTGCIKPGMKADIILLDTDQPHFYPMNGPVSAVVYTAQASDVDTVIVDGNILMENRELKMIDEEKAKFMVKEISREILSGV